MEELQSKLVGMEITMKELIKQSEPLGFEVGGGWEYDHGYLDYKVKDDGMYHFVRIPFFAVSGEVSDKEALVKLGQPFVLNHAYEDGVDEEVDNYNALMNQFASPEDPDAKVDPDDLSEGEKVLRSLEKTLTP
ncbi:YugN family protein [Salsuginibacillus kocurii]|uniref:YugN family protein n=1 Tax=Salsuginibacillus kocurii TaxID=427078 RepID=UPI00037DA8C5|nr:YugN family protein [Salsuginibacillus kocurii]